MQMVVRKRYEKTASPLRCAVPQVSGAPLPRSNATHPEKTTDPTGITFLIAQMLFCVVGINLCFGWWSVKQERVIKMPYSVSAKSAVVGDATGADLTQKEVFLSTVYGITLTQTLTGFLVSAMLLGFHNIACRLIKPQNTSKATTQLQIHPKLTLHDIPALFVMGFSNICGNSLGYASMRRLSYPVTLTAKMGKMVPVMLVGSIWYHTRYPARKVLSCLLITTGVIVFALLDQRSASHGNGATTTNTVASSSSLSGVVLLILNLLMDGYTNSTQDVLVRRHRWSGPLLMMWTNFASFICVLYVLVLLELGEQPWAWLCSFGGLVFPPFSGSSDQVHVSTASVSLTLFPFHDLSNFVSFLAHCSEARNDVLLMAVLNAVGQLFIFHTISIFGTLTVTAMTLMRKVGSVLLSIYVHGHLVRPSQWAALTTVFVGIVSEGYINLQEASQRQRHRHAPSSSAANSPSAAPATAKSTSVKTSSLPHNSSSSSISMVTDSRSNTPVSATVEHCNK